MAQYEVKIQHKKNTRNWQQKKEFTMIWKNNTKILYL